MTRITPAQAREALINAVSKDGDAMSENPEGILTAFINQHEEMEAALKPFAAVGNAWNKDLPDDIGLAVCVPSPCTSGYPDDFTLGDLRRAAAATKGGGAPS